MMLHPQTMTASVNSSLLGEREGTHFVYLNKKAKKREKEKKKLKNK